MSKYLARKMHFFVRLRCFFLYCSSIWSIHSIFTGYSWGIHMYRLCVGYVSVMYRLCIGYVSEHIRSEEVCWCAQEGLKENILRGREAIKSYRK